jgi:hydrogenase-4 component F
MPLTSILVAPFLVAALCLAVRRRGLLALLNLAGFAVVLVLGVRLLATVVTAGGRPLTEWGEFLRADALSAWMVLLIAVVSLGAALYAASYFRRDLADGAVTDGRVR